MSTGQGRTPPRRALASVLPPLLASLLAFLPLPPAIAAPVAAQGGALRIYGMDSKPVSYREDGQPAGLAVDVARHIQQRLGRSDPIEIIPWARANTVANAQPNVMLLSIVRTPQRAQRLLFVGPIFMAYISAFAVKERAAEIRAMGEGIYKLRSGARRGSIFVERARGHGYNLTDEPVSSEAAARMLMLRRFDLWFDGEEIVGPALEQAGYARADVELVKQLSLEEVYFAFSNGTAPATVQAWDSALRDMKRDGSFQKIYRKWLPHYPLPADARAAESRKP
ncbi:ABC transporter substrate-binding protein [Massilia sp. Root418]|uniref:substrate-binding periplasmic protein n=1 Tax=Massilia sp. Root418 TaxID=1736532 RepID=UPI0009EC8E2D|nr:transporter substrate-binding domain-containing protein [Massilia sp. Root418]